MASSFKAALGALAAMLFWTCLGLSIARRLVPRPLALPMAPVAGWAVHSAVALPIFLVLQFSAMNVGAVAGFVLLAGIAASRATARPDQADIGPTVPAWAYVPAALLAMAPAAAVLPKEVGDAVILADPIFDHVKVAIIDDIVNFGVPAGNPFFAAPDAPRIAYYYLLHFSAAELAIATGISGWEADVALTWFSAAASLALMMGLAVWVSGRAGAAILVVILSAAASARMPLWWIFGQERVDAIVGRAAGFAGWLFQSAWAPQHIMSASCVVLATVLMSRLAERGSALLVATLGLVAAAGFESSTWIGGITFAAAAPVAALVLVIRAGPRQARRFIAALAVAGVLAACLAIPFVRDQVAVSAMRGDGSPVALQFYPVLGDYFSSRLRGMLDPPAFWLVLLAIEIPAAYLIGLAALARLATSPTHDREPLRSIAPLAAMAGTSLTVAWILASTLAENNDIGWRAILPGIMALTAFAAVGMAQWIADRGRIAVMAAACIIVLGLPGGADLIRGDIAGRFEAAGTLFAEAPELWAAVRRHSTAGERVGNNPLFLGEMTLWPINISWALLSKRRSCYAGRESTVVYTWMPQRRRDEIDAQFIRVFAGDGSPDDVRELAERYDCRAIVVTATDGAWRRDPFGASPAYRLAEAKPDRWRIYRATAPGDRAGPASARRAQ